MARTNTYGHYCPAARTLEVVGEKWSLLLVRDLLQQPQRFSDLQHSLGGITPKLLTTRLRDLENAGVIERDEQPGRRDVWYRLSASGEALRPVIRELLVWGVEHAPGPERHEPTSSRAVVGGAVATLNARQRFPDRPVLWEIAFDSPATRRLVFDGTVWTSVPVDETHRPDVCVSTTPDTWIAVLRGTPDDAAALLGTMDLSGRAPDIQRFIAFFAGTR